MHRILKLGRPRRVAGVALAATFASSGVALAIPPYTVSVHVVPRVVRLSGTFKVTAVGNSANTSRLRVFLNKTTGCKATAAAESVTPGDFLRISVLVTNGYSVSKTFPAAIKGHHYACAYLNALPPSTLPRAHAGQAYTVG